jgi:hypothetical protein
MSDILKTLLSLGITAGLSDREAFVREVSGLIHEYQQDPEKAQKWAKALVEYLETLRNNINTESVIKSAMSGSHLPDKSQVEKLTVAIEELTKELQEKKKAG